MEDIALHLFSEVSLLFSLLPKQFWDVTWPLLPSSSISLSLLIVVIFVFSCICNILFIIPPHFHFLRLYSLCLFHVWDTLLSAPSPCLRKSVYWIGCCIILPHLMPHLELVDDWHVNFSPVVVASFLSLGLLACTKTNSPPPLSVQGYRHWEAWDLLPDCLAG